MKCECLCGSLHYKGISSLDDYCDKLEVENKTRADRIEYLTEDRNLEKRMRQDVDVRCSEIEAENSRYKKALEEIEEKLKSLVVTETVYRPKCDQEIEVLHLSDLESIFSLAREVLGEK